MFVVPLGATK